MTLLVWDTAAGSVMLPTNWKTCLTLYERLRAAGLVEVGMEGHFAVWPGGSPRAQFDRATVAQVRDEAVARGLVTADEIEQALAQLQDPAIAFSSPVMCSA